MMPNVFARYAPVALLVAAALNPGCSCSHANGLNNGKHDLGGAGGAGGTGGAGGAGGAGEDMSVDNSVDMPNGSSVDLAGSMIFGNHCQAPAMLTLAPASPTTSVTPGASYSQAFTATATYADGSSADVTASTFFAISDPSAGTLNGNTFTWGGDHGGTVTVSGLECGATATTTLTLNMSAAIGAGGVNGGTASGTFGTSGGNSTNPSCTGANAPQLLYPTDGTLVPPNMNVMEVHFSTGGTTATLSNTLFEISFENAITDVKVYTQCTSTTDPTAGMQVAGTPPGCIFALSQSEWNYIAHTNRNGGAITIKVRAIGCDGNKVSSSTTRSISFAKDDLVGALYYWASINTTSAGTYQGGIFSYNFGVPGQSPLPVLTPSTKVNGTANGNCIGCHVVSKDGRKLLFDYDDNNGDDEYSDVGNGVWDIASGTPSGGSISSNHSPLYPPGYGTWNHGTTQFLISDGTDVATPAGALTDRKADGTSIGTTQPTPPVANMRATTPDWAPDDSQVAFSYVPTNGSNTPPYGAGFWKTEISNSDEWFAGGSLYVAPWNAATHSLGAPRQLLASVATTGPAGASAVSNYYYPNFSPDGSLLAFNYAPWGANFHNPQARVQLLSMAAGTPTADDLVNLNCPTGNAYTNSWPRFSPFVQTYQSGKLLWITFSSTRPYGLRIANNGTFNCYPTSGPDLCGSTAGCFHDFTKTAASSCSRTQIWMAAINLDPTAVQNGTDVSYPAFWLPFQDLSTNNHLAQWAQQQFTSTCSVDGDCNTNGKSGNCCFSGACATCLAAPPPASAQCAQDSNCAPGMCCEGGACAACPMDGGAGGTGGSGGGGGSGGMSGCNTCLDCQGQACNAGVCGSCKTSADCCAGLNCDTASGKCVAPIS